MSKNVWLKIATELELAESTDREGWQLRQVYKRRLLAMKEQALRYSLIEDKS